MLLLFTTIAHYVVRLYVGKQPELLSIPNFLDIDTVDITL